MFITPDGLLLQVTSSDIIDSKIIIPENIRRIDERAFWDIKKSADLHFTKELYTDAIAALCNPYKDGQLNFQQRIGASLKKKKPIYINIVINGTSYKYEYLNMPKNSDNIRLTREHLISPNLQILEEHRFKHIKRDAETYILYQMAFSASGKDTKFDIPTISLEAFPRTAVIKFHQNCAAYLKTLPDKESDTKKQQLTEKFYFDNIDAIMEQLKKINRGAYYSFPKLQIIRNGITGFWLIPYNER